jgi:hypothetical protein
MSGRPWRSDRHLGGAVGGLLDGLQVSRPFLSLAILVEHVNAPHSVLVGLAVEISPLDV